MILRAFSSNRPVLLLALPVLAGALAWPLLVSGPIPTMASQYRVDRMLEGQWFAGAPLIISLVCLLLGSIQVNRLFNRHEFHDSPTYIPSLIYFVSGIGLLFLQFSPSVYIANLFVILGLHPLLSVYRQQRVLSEYFRAGLGMGMAALIFPPYTSLLAALWVCIIYTRAFNWREHLLSLIGFGIPFLYWVSYAYYTGTYNNIVLFHLEFGVDKANGWLHEGWVTRAFVISLALSFLLALPRYLFLSQRSTNKARNVKTVFFILGIGLISSIFTSHTFSGKWLISGWMLPLAIVSGYWYTNYRYSLVAPVVFYLSLFTATLLCLQHAGVLTFF